MSLDDIVGPFIEIYLFGQLNSQIPHDPVWWVTIGFGVNAGIHVSFLSFVNIDWDLPGGPYDIPTGGWGIAHAPNYPPYTPVLIILNTVIDLSNPSFLDPKPINGWGATMSAEPEGETVTCIWMSNEAGQLGTTMATGASLLACPSPSLASFPINQILTKSLHQLTVTVVAEDSAGAKSSPSNAVTVHVLLPTPTLQILYPTPPSQGSTVSPATIVQNQPFTAHGSATLATTITSSTPNGLLDLCQTEPQNIAWFVGGYYQALVGEGEGGGWVGAQSSGTSCNPPLTAKSAGQTTITMALITTIAGYPYIAQDNKGNPIYVSVTVHVEAQTSQPPSEGTQLSVHITTPSEPATGYRHTPTSNPTVLLAGTVSGGTSPYTATWTAQYEGKTYTIATLSSRTLLPRVPFPDDDWTVCSTLTGIRGVADVFLSVTDSKSVTQHADNNPIQISLNCQVAQSIPPILPVALVSLLTVLFAVTAECNTAIVEMKPWLRSLEKAFILRGNL